MTKLDIILYIVCCLPLDSFMVNMGKEVKTEMKKQRDIKLTKKVYYLNSIDFWWRIIIIKWMYVFDNCEENRRKKLFSQKSSR